MAQHPPAPPGLRAVRRLWERLTEPGPAVTRTDERREARLVAGLLLTLMLLNACSALVQLITVPGFWPTALVLGAAMAALGGAYALSRSPRYRVAALGLALLPSLVAFGSVLANPRDVVAVVFLVIGAIVCSIFGAVRWMLALAAVNLAGVLLLPLLTAGRVTLAQVTGPAAFITIVSAFLTLATHYRNTVERERRARLSAAVDELTLANRRLEEELARRKQLEGELVRAQRLESVGLLAGGVAHDFNNLLTAIRGYSEFALEGLGPGEAARGDLQEVLRASERGALLVRRLLAFARRQALEPAVLDLNQQIAETENLLRRLVDAQVELELRLEPGLWPVLADPAQVEQILFNLAVNARDAMPAGGRLTIETSNLTLSEEQAAQRVGVAAGEYVALTVSDTGTGMSPEVQRHAFEPFFTTKAPGHGSGLGLATCYGIVRQHSGAIWLQSEEGRGTTFRIFLPRSRATPRPAAAAHDGEAMPRGSEIVLVVEDEAPVRAFALRLLGGLGYTVLGAADGAEALQIVGSLPAGRVDLILTDVVMPRLSGASLVESIRARGGAVRVLYVTGYAVGPAGGQRELDGPVLQKPFTPASLARKVREVLDAAAPA